MLSRPDFLEKQILFVQAQDIVKNKLQFHNQNIRLLHDEKPAQQLSCSKIFAIFVIGDFSITTKLIQQCQQYGISLFLLKKNLSLYATFNAQAFGNYVLREKQYDMSKEQALSYSKKLVINKIKNQYQLLKSVKSHDDIDLEGTIIKINSAKNFQEVLGIEGAFGKKFFGQYFDEYGWYKRMPRAKVDEINVLMDIGYTFLFNFIDALLSLYGFDTYKGFYHQLYFQRKSLACDLVEPFRCIIDKQIRKSFNLKQIDLDDFEFKNGQYSLSYKNQRKYLKFFSESLMAHKEDMYIYVRNFYFMLMNGQDFPEFNIKK